MKASSIIQAGFPPLSRSILRSSIVVALGLCLFAVTVTACVGPGKAVPTQQSQNTVQPPNEAADVPKPVEPIPSEPTAQPKGLVPVPPLGPSGQAPSVSAEAEAPDVEAGPVLVTASRESYTVTQATTATKTETPVFQTPYHVNVVPNAVLKDQQAYRLEDAVKNVSGVQVNAFGLYNSNFTIRGFQTNNVVYRDGFRQFQPQLDMANVEQVEVLKGAAGSLYGRIEPGGLINLVIKKPLSQARYSVEQQFGSFQFYRTVADATGPLTKDGTLLYRAILAFQDNHSFREQGQNRHLLFSPSLSWQITPQTQWYGNFEYKDFDDAIDNGIPALGNRPASVPLARYFGVANRPLSNTKHYTVDTHLTHHLNQDWSVKVRGAWWKYKATLFDSGPSALQPDGQTLDVYLAAPYRDNSETYFAEAMVTGRFQTWAIQHKMVLGVEYYNRKSDQRYFFDSSDSGSGLLQPINLFNPTYQFFPNLGALSPNNVFQPKDRWTSGYIQDQLTFFDRLHLHLSARYDYTTASSLSCDTGTDPTCPAVSPSRKNFGRVTPRIGVNYEATSWLALFGSFSRGFADTNFFAGSLPDGTAPKPETAEQGEVGLKVRGLQDRLLATLTFYHLTKDNVTVPVPGLVNVVTQIGQFRNRGIELDVVGQVTDEWKLITTFSYIDSVVRRDGDDTGGPGNQGNRLFNVPRFSGSLWSDYQWQAGMLKGLGVGGGMFAASGREGDTENTFQLPGYVRVDAAIHYGWTLGSSDVTVRFNVYNLLDQQYFLGTNGTNVSINPAVGRMFLGQISWGF